MKTLYLVTDNFTYCDNNHGLVNVSNLLTKLSAILINSTKQPERDAQVTDTNWITEILLDIARFSEENKLPKTYETLIDTIKVFTIEARYNDAQAKYAESNVIPLFERKTVSFTVT